MSAPKPPADVIAAVVDLRDAYGELHQMHECDEHCREDCGESDYSDSAYRYHDERNADVCEDIELKAASLVDTLEEWLGADELASARGEVS